jgi:hypothetical protein
MSELETILDQVKTEMMRGDIAPCETFVAAKLKQLPRTPFHLVLDLSVTNDPASVAAYFDEFFEQEAAKFNIRAAYAEMNGFAFNTNSWHFDVFAYQIDGGDDDYDWLADWQSDYVDSCEISGLERLQEVYASEAFSNKQFDDASELCSGIVLLKFLQLIQDSTCLMLRHRFPLYATFHGLEHIACFRP